MVAQHDPKDNLILAWSFEHTHGQEIMIDDDHIGGGYFICGYGVLHSGRAWWAMTDERYKRSQTG